MTNDSFTRCYWIQKKSKNMFLWNITPMDTNISESSGCVSAYGPVWPVVMIQKMVDVLGFLEVVCVALKMSNGLVTWWR